MLNINQYVSNIQSRSRSINYGQLQKITDIKSESPQTQEEKIQLSNNETKLSEYLTKLTLKLFKIETNDIEIKKDVKDLNTGLNYFI